MTRPKTELVINAGDKVSFTPVEGVLQVKVYDKFQRRVVRKQAIEHAQKKRGLFRMRKADISTRLAEMRAARRECRRLASNSHEARRLWNAELDRRRAMRELERLMRSPKLNSERIAELRAQIGE